MRLFFIRFFLYLAFAQLCFSAPVAAQDSGNHFDKVSIRYLIGSKPGGGYDQYGRLVAKYLGKHLPGSTIIPENRPTAGGIPALRQVRYADAGKPFLMMFNTGLLLSDLGGLDTLDFGLNSLAWVGKAASEARVLVVRENAGIANFADLQNRSGTAVFLASGFGSAAFVQQKLITDAFDLNIRVVPGFGGSEAEAALAKGEADGFLASESNVPPIVDAGIARPVLYFGTPTTDYLKGVPKAESVAETPDQILVTGAITALSKLGRVTVVSPSVGHEGLAALRKAYMAAVSDPEFLAEAALFRLSIDALNGEETQALAETLLEGEPRLRELVAKTLQQ